MGTPKTPVYRFVNRVYGQRDPNWSAQHLGYPQAAADSTLGKYGCAVCCVAMLLNESKLPESYDPPLVNHVLTDKKLYIGSSYNLIAWPDLTQAWDRLVWRGRFDCPMRAPKPAEWKEVLTRLRAGMPVIIYVDALAKEPGLQQHFVLAAGIGAEDWQIWIADPWHGDFAPLVPRYGKTVAQALCGAVLYDYSGAAPNLPQPINPPTL